MKKIYTISIIIFVIIIIFTIFNSKSKMTNCQKLISRSKIKSDEELFELKLTWKQVLNLMLKEGKVPIEFPDYDFMIKCKPVKNLNDKFTYKFIRTKFSTKPQDIGPFSQNPVFAAELGKTNPKLAVCFDNISGSTKMVVPTPQKGADFAHLKIFLDTASPSHKKELWKRVAKAFISKKTVDNTLYLSTHGKGVHYLHIRIKASNDYGYPTSFDF